MLRAPLGRVAVVFGVARDARFLLECGDSMPLCWMPGAAFWLVIPNPVARFLANGGEGSAVPAPGMHPLAMRYPPDYHGLIEYI